MLKHLYTVAFVTFFSCMASANTLDPEHPKAGPWNRELQTKDATIYTREIEGQIIREVKIQTQLETSMKALLTVLADVEQFGDWVPFLEKVDWVQQPNAEGVSYAYVLTALPWPIKNRDAYIKTSITYNPELKQVIMKSVSEATYKPAVEGIIRIPASSAHWIITDNGTDKLDVEMMSHADPGGAMPKWLINFAVITGPMQMLKNIKKALADEKWNDTYPYDMDFVFGYPSPI